MADKDLFNPRDTAAINAGDPPIKKKKVDPNALAAMPDLLKKRPLILPPKKSAVIETGAPNFPKPGDPYWKKHPLETEHKDGSVRIWGEDTTVRQNPNLLPKQMLPPTPVKNSKPTLDLSDKAKGFSSNYYPPNH